MHRIRRELPKAVLAAVIATAGPVTWSAEFRSVADNAAVLYDAPSARSKKVYVVSQGYPLEVVVAVEGWVKVRDANGDFTWIEQKALSDKRTVMVKVPVASVRQDADERAPVVFQAQQHVILEVVDATVGGWLRVRHRDGQGGFVRITDVWGA